MNIYLEFIKVKRTQIEMMIDRGYVVPQEELDMLNSLNSEEMLTKFNKLYPDITEQNQPFLYYIYSKVPVRGAPFERVAVAILHHPFTDTPYSKNLSETEVKAIITKAFENKITHIIIISRAAVEAFIDKELVRISGLQIEIFHYSRLFFNISKHLYVPKHELMTEEETKDLLTNISKSQLPQISYNDPVVRYYNFPVGSIIRIHRDNSILPVSVTRTYYYRLVSPIPFVYKVSKEKKKDKK